MAWKPIKTFKKNNQEFPNRLIMLLVKEKLLSKSDRSNSHFTTRTPLTDVAPNTPFTTMGHWFPPLEDEPGYWVVVGWNWDNDYFTDDYHAEVLAWQELPKAKLK